jgi:hypothetical protein
MSAFGELCSRRMQGYTIVITGFQHEGKIYAKGSVHMLPVVRSFLHVTCRYECGGRALQNNSIDKVYPTEWNGIMKCVREIMARRNGKLSKHENLYLFDSFQTRMHDWSSTRD